MTYQTNRQHLFVLTPRENEILGLLKTGQTSQEIANTLFVTKRDIDYHLWKLYRKLGCKNRIQAIDIFLSQEIVVRDFRKLRKMGTFSSKQRHLLELAALGLSNMQIARHMNVETESEIKECFSQLFKELGVPGRQAAISKARKLGMLCS